MYKSETFGRIFWVDCTNEFRSCPLKLDNTGDFDNIDYVSEWQDLEGVNLDMLLKIHRKEVLTQEKYGMGLVYDDQQNEITKKQLNDIKGSLL